MGKLYYKLGKILHTEGSYEKLRRYIDQSWSKNLFPTLTTLIFLLGTRPSRDTFLQIRSIWFKGRVHKIRRNRHSEGEIFLGIDIILLDLAEYEMHLSL